MKVTGYQLREAIKQQELRRDAAVRAFPSALKAFPDELPEQSPIELSSLCLEAEARIASLQTAQMAYNLKVRVTVAGENMPLAAAIKLIGGISRAEKMWRSAVAPKVDRYSFSDETRKTDEVVKRPTISTKDAQARVVALARQTSAMREAIALGNATAVEIEGLDGSFFE